LRVAPVLLGIDARDAVGDLSTVGRDLRIGDRGETEVVFGRDRAFVGSQTARGGKKQDGPSHKADYALSAGILKDMGAQGRPSAERSLHPDSLFPTASIDIASNGPSRERKSAINNRRL